MKYEPIDERCEHDFPAGQCLHEHCCFSLARICDLQSGIIKKIACRVLPESEVYGDGTDEREPGIVAVTELLVKEIERLRGTT